MPTDEDLFAEEEQMVRMTFGEHIEELRRRLILALLGFVPAVALGLLMGGQLMGILQSPVETRLQAYYQERKEEKRREFNPLAVDVEYAAALDQKNLPGPLLQAFSKADVRVTPAAQVEVEAKGWRWRVADRAESLVLRRETVGEGERINVYRRSPNSRRFHFLVPVDGLVSALKRSGTFPADTAAIEESGEFMSTPDGPGVELTMWIDQMELDIAAWNEKFQALITLSPQEAFMAWMKVSLVAGLVLASPWIIYHLWAFVAEGLYGHERRVVYKAAPSSIGLFLAGVLFCFVVVLPVVIQFFFGFNLWLGLEPGIRLTEWLGFATLLPVIFGLCFELPIVMLVLDGIGIFDLGDFISKWRHAVLGISVVAMVVTPTTDPGSMMLLMGPMCGLYFLGIFVVRMRYARRGEAPPLSAAARVAVWLTLLGVIYITVLKTGFFLHYLNANWSEAWWFDSVWRPATLPTRWLIEKMFWELSLETPGRITVTTLANACVIGFFLFRLWEWTGKKSEERSAKTEDAGGDDK